MCQTYYPPASDELAYLFKVDVSDARWKSELQPGMRAPVVRGIGDTRNFSIMNWGFTQPWSEERLPHARVDKSWDASLWAEAMDAGRRCLMPAVAYLRWIEPGQQDDGQQARSQRMALEGGNPFAFAGLWEARGDELYIAMLLSSPHGLLDATGGRQPSPVVLDGPEAWDRWCAPETPLDDLQALWNVPLPPGRLIATGA